MKKEWRRDYLRRSGMDPAQADALARILDAMETRLATKADVDAAKADLKLDIASLRADLTWRFIAVTTLLATSLTVLDLFVG